MKPEEFSTVISMDPVVSKELSMKRTKTFKDPASKPKINGNSDFFQKLQNLPTKKLNTIITPHVLKAEEQAIHRIAMRILNEQAMQEEIQTVWREKNRLQLRDKLHMRHEQNRKIQKMAGISKPLYTQSVSQESVHQSIEEQHNLHEMDQETLEQIAQSDKMSLPSHLSSCPSENLNQKSNNNNARPFTSLGQTRNAMNYSNYANNNDSYRSKQKTQRCQSTQPRMKFGYMTHTNYRFKPQINRLAVPKATPTQVSYSMLFKHSQFSGLLQAKHPDAIRNCSSFKHKKSFDLFQESRNMNKTYIQGSRTKTLHQNIGIANSLASQTGFSQGKMSLTQRRLSKSLKDVFPIPRSAIGINKSAMKSMHLDQDLNINDEQINNNKLKVTVSMGHNSLAASRRAETPLMIARPSTSLGINASKISSIHPQSVNSTTQYESRQAYGALGRYSNLNDDNTNSRGVIQERDTISQDDYLTRTSAAQKSKKAIYRNQEAEETFDLMKQFEKNKRSQILSNNTKGYPRIQYESQMNNGGRGIHEEDKVNKDKKASSTIIASESNILQSQRQQALREMTSTSKESLGPISQILGSSSSILSIGGGKAGTQIQHSTKMLIQRQQLESNKIRKVASSMRGLNSSKGKIIVSSSRIQDEIPRKLL